MQLLKFYLHRLCAPLLLRPFACRGCAGGAIYHAGTMRPRRRFFRSQRGPTDPLLLLPTLSLFALPPSPSLPPCLLDTFFHRLRRHRRRRRRSSFNYVPRIYVLREKRRKGKLKKGEVGENRRPTPSSIPIAISPKRDRMRGPGGGDRAKSRAMHRETKQSRSRRHYLASPCSLSNPTHSFFPCRFGISDLCRPCCFRSVPSSSLSFPLWPAPGPPRVPLRRTQVRAFGQTETRAAP